MSRKLQVAGNDRNTRRVMLLPAQASLLTSEESTYDAGLQLIRTR